MYVRQLFEVRKGMTEMEQSKQYTQLTQDWLQLTSAAKVKKPHNTWTTGKSIWKYAVSVVGSKQSLTQSSRLEVALVPPNNLEQAFKK